MLDVHKDFISLFQVNIIKAETLVKAIEDGQTQFPDNITLWKMRTKYTKIETVLRSNILNLEVIIGVFVFPGPRPSAWPLTFALAPNLYLPALAPNFYLPALVSPEPGLAYTKLVRPICVFWPWPTIFIIVL